MFLLLSISALLSLSFVLSTKSCQSYKDCISCSTTAMIKDTQIRCTWVGGICKQLYDEGYEENVQSRKWYKYFEKCEIDPSYKTEMEKYLLVSQENSKNLIITFKDNNGIYAQKETFFNTFSCYELSMISLDFSYSIYNLEDDDKFLLVIKDPSGLVSDVQKKEEFFSNHNHVFHYSCFSIYYFNSQQKNLPPFQIELQVTSAAAIKKRIILVVKIFSIIFGFCSVSTLATAFYYAYRRSGRVCNFKCCSCSHCCSCSRCCSWFSCCEKKNTSRPDHVETPKNSFEKPKFFKESKIKNKKIDINEIDIKIGNDDKKVEGVENVGRRESSNCSIKKTNV